MSIHIETESFRVEVLNHPDDIYLYFNGGYAVWNCKSGPRVSLWFNDDMFTLDPATFCLDKLRMFATGN